MDGATSVNAAHRWTCIASGFLRHAEHSGAPVRHDCRGPINIEIYIQGPLGLLYVNKDTAFGFRMYNHRNRRTGAFSTEGGLHVNGLRVLTDK